MKVAFSGSFAVRLAEPVKSQLSIPCDVVAGDEAAMIAELADTDVLVSMGFNKAMAEASPNLELVQVPGAGLDRIERAALRSGVHLANAYGHEAGIAEYVIGTMLALTRSFGRIDARLRKGEWESNGPSMRQRHRSGRSLPVRRSAFSASVISVRRLPAAPWPST